MTSYSVSPHQHERFDGDSHGHGVEGRLSTSTASHDHDENSRPRAFSVSLRVNSLRQAGGVNSLDNFARSWQRAAGFHEITPARASFRFYETEDDQDSESFARRDIESTPGSHGSLLRQALKGEDRRPSDNVVVDDHDANEQTPLIRQESRSTVESPTERRLSGRRGSQRYESIFTIEPSLASPFGGSYGTSFGSLASRLNESSMRHAGRLFTQQQVAGVPQPDKEREPILVKQVEEGGNIINVVVGRSTLPQTIVNSINVLIGVGLLSLPLAFKYSGWLIGMLFFLFSAVTTSYTAKLLAKCLDVDSSLITFADLAYVSFGPRARVATSILFSLELLIMCVALVILFADSLDALIPGWGVVEWKIVCGLILIPLEMLPLQLLSFTSVLGIFCCFGTPWGGHSIFPNIYRDMRHPHKYRRGLNITYLLTYPLDLFIGIVGLLMFGEHIRDEVTGNIFTTPEYPRAITVLIVVCVAIIPLTKIPLNARPIISTLEILCGIESRAMASTNGLVGVSALNRGLLSFGIRVFAVTVFVVLAILVPDFDRMMSLMGSVACFTICIILPLSFHLKLFSEELSRTKKLVHWFLIIFCSVTAIVSTVFACLPREILES